VTASLLFPAKCAAFARPKGQAVTVLFRRLQICPETIISQCKSLFKCFEGVNFSSNLKSKVFFADVTRNRFIIVLCRFCLSFRKEKNKLKMRRFWKNDRKPKGRMAISLHSVKRVRKYYDSRHYWIDPKKNLLYTDTVKCRNTGKGV